MSRDHHIQKALNRAAARDRKHQKRFRVTGTGVFTLQRLLRSKKAKQSGGVSKGA